MTNKSKMRLDTTPAGGLSELELHQIVGYQLAQAAITTDRVFSKQVGVPIGMRRVEYTLLMLIRENPGCSAARLARALAVTAPNITALVARLEESGWVVREQNATDRRSQHLHISAKGAKITADTTKLLVEGEREALVGLSAGERAILIELLHKVATGRPT